MVIHAVFALVTVLVLLVFVAVTLVIVLILVILAAVTILMLVVFVPVTLMVVVLLIIPVVILGIAVISMSMLRSHGCSCVFGIPFLQWWLLTFQDNDTLSRK